MSSTSTNVLSNIFFDSEYYLTEKTKALNASGTQDTVWTNETTAEAITNAGMTPWQHFIKHGAYETNASGEVGIDPGALFSVSDYYNALAAAENISVSAAVAEVRGAGGPIAHYAEQGYQENILPTTVVSDDRAQFSSRLDLFKSFYFDADEYLANKTAALNSIHYQGQEWTPEMTAEAIANAGMTVQQHFMRCGAFEKDANGDIGIDPSQYFDVSRYFSEKSELVGLSVEETANAFKAVHIDPLTHYAKFGVAEQLTVRATSLDPVSVTEDTNVIPRSGNSLIDSVLVREDMWPQLNRIAADDGIVRYHMLTDSEIAANTENQFENMTQLNSNQESAFETGFSVLSKMTGIEFAETDTYEDAHIRIATASLSNNTGLTFYGFGWGNSALTVVLDNSAKTPENVDPTFGKEGFQTVCHELGHALGLEHPFETETEGDGLTHVQLPKSLETTAMTIMSYDRGNTVTNADGEAVAPWCVDGTYYYSPTDILALQYLYGTDGINGEEGIVYDTTVLA
ncbi:MAG: hypothetical protein IJU76_00070 [Desulfovibrionaceae bacterium]|nr:hypothetical protein [Desulfovibrionaceae bacterium]